ncbi:uncharacterized protein LOC143656563 [Tamandua tetradactyla]|uniref:uncharacterized protein LOC143656563 n=1 Tax=Tamandua tetradactyla TaxID=48850 RepID=UPI0040539C01
MGETQDDQGEAVMGEAATGQGPQLVAEKPDSGPGFQIPSASGTVPNCRASPLPDTPRSSPALDNNLSRRPAPAVLGLHEKPAWWTPPLNQCRGWRYELHPEHGRLEASPLGGKSGGRESSGTGGGDRRQYSREGRAVVSTELAQHCLTEELFATQPCAPIAESWWVFVVTVHPQMGCHLSPSCTGYGGLVDYLEGIQKNFDEAAKVLKFNCEENQHRDSCYKLGAYYVTGKGGLTRDQEAALGCFLMACEKPGKKSVEACHNVGLLAHDGQVSEDSLPDLGKARDCYPRACDGSYASSCFSLSAVFLQGAPSFPKDMSLAWKFSVKACGLGRVWACANASRMCKLGDGVDKDEAVFLQGAPSFPKDMEILSESLWPGPCLGLCQCQPHVQARGWCR